MNSPLDTASTGLEEVRVPLVSGEQEIAEPSLVDKAYAEHPLVASHIRPQSEANIAQANFHLQKADRGKIHTLVLGRLNELGIPSIGHAALLQGENGYHIENGTDILAVNSTRFYAIQQVTKALEDAGIKQENIDLTFARHS